MLSDRQIDRESSLFTAGRHSAGKSGGSVGQSGRAAWEVERSFIVRMINAGGRLLGPYARAGLTQERLISSACRKTGFDDFGALSFHEPLRRLIDSMETEADLNPVGRLAAREDLIRLLANDLLMEEDRKRNPAIAEEEIGRPVIITGLPRTGTTLLHSLLALDPANRVPVTWETMYPSPPPEASTCNTDRRIRQVEGQIRWFRRLVKGFERIHPVGPCLPEECLIILSHSFMSYQFETTYRLPSYLEWLEGADLREAYEVHRRFLQHLQWRCAGKRWVLKAPAHMFAFEAMFRVYEDACVVMTHRDPIEVSASNASLTATLRSAFSDGVDPLEVGPECSRRWAEAIDRAVRSRDGSCAPAERFVDIYYSDLISDPAGAVRMVYRSFDLPLPDGMEERIRGFLGKNPKDRFGKHRYRLEEFGLDREGEERRYASYRERFQL
jgi:hypothetical protein